MHTFVHFSIACDRVPRQSLIKELLNLGCGVVMVSALGAFYTDTSSVLGLALITAAVGVHQAAPSS